MRCEGCRESGAQPAPRNDTGPRQCPGPAPIPRRREMSYRCAAAGKAKLSKEFSATRNHW